MKDKLNSHFYRFTTCQLLPLHVSCCHHMSVVATTCQLLPLHVSCCHYMSVVVTVCQLLPPHVSCCHYMSVVVKTCRLLSSHVSYCYHMSVVVSWSKSAENLFLTLLSNKKMNRDTERGRQHMKFCPTAHYLIHISIDLSWLLFLFSLTSSRSLPPLLSSISLIR